MKGYNDAIAFAENESGLKELDYNPSSSDNTEDYSAPIEIPDSIYSYVVFTAVRTGEKIGIRTAETIGGGEWKWIDP